MKYRVILASCIAFLCLSTCAMQANTNAAPPAEDPATAAVNNTQQAPAAPPVVEQKLSPKEELEAQAQHAKERNGFIGEIARKLMGFIVMISASYFFMCSLQASCWGQSSLKTSESTGKSEYEFIAPSESDLNRRGVITLMHGIWYIVFLIVGYFLFFSI